MPFRNASLGLLLVIAAATPMANTTSGTVVETLPMSAPRFAHSATTLFDGRVLVVGGFTEQSNAAHAVETYDANTGRFTTVSGMTSLRQSHTATLLPNGKVLIAGGYTVGSTVTATAEVFDPATNTFSATGSMRAPRGGHVAVLLNNGTVLLAGGVGPEWTFLSSAELFDPATGQFTTTGSMTDARESHAAVRLIDGRVLIAGGHRDRRANIKLYTSAEVYSANTGTFTKVGDMNVRRHKHDALLLRNGQVLVTGGSDERDNLGAYNSTEWFDPKTGTFSMGPQMQRARYKHNGSALELPNGIVLIAGGATEAETYDPSTRSFSLATSQSRMAGQFSAVAPLGNGALITGGYGDGTSARASAWLYRP